MRHNILFVVGSVGRVSGTSLLTVSTETYSKEVLYVLRTFCTRCPSQHGLHNKIIKFGETLHQSISDDV